MLNKQEVFSLYDSGHTLKYIGDKFGVSRQRVSQYMRRHREGNFTPRGGRAGKHVLPRPSETYVLGLLTLHGIPAEHRGYNDHFDILAQGKRIEVKHRSKSKREGKYTYYRFHNLSGFEPVDFFVFVCGDINRASCYVVPSSEVGKDYAISPSPTTAPSIRKARLYKEAWHLIKTAP